MKKDKKSMKEIEERKWEIHKALGRLYDKQKECDQLEKNIISFEEESQWQNKKIKSVNDDLYDSYPEDNKLRTLLLEKEDLMKRKMSDENLFIEECYNLVRTQKRNIEYKREEYEQELFLLNRKEDE